MSNAAVKIGVACIFWLVNQKQLLFSNVLQNIPPTSVFQVMIHKLLHISFSVIILHLRILP